MMLSRNPHRSPAGGLVSRFDQHPGHRGGPLAGRQNPHLVVEQAHLSQLGIKILQRLAQSVVQSIDRPVPFGGGMLDLASDLDLDGGLGRRFFLLMPFGIDDPEADHGKDSACSVPWPCA